LRIRAMWLLSSASTALFYLRPALQNDCWPNWKRQRGNGRRPRQSVRRRPRSSRNRKQQSGSSDMTRLRNVRTMVARLRHLVRSAAPTLQTPLPQSAITATTSMVTMIKKGSSILGAPAAHRNLCATSNAGIATRSKPWFQANSPPQDISVWKHHQLLWTRIRGIGRTASGDHSPPATDPL